MNFILGVKIMADFKTLMINRRSIRKFIENKKIPQEILDKIISAAFYAPSAANVHGFEIIIVTEPTLKNKIRDVCEKGEYSWVFAQPEEVKESILSLPDYSFQKEFLSEAPLLLVISTNPNNPSIPYAIESCWLSIAYILLAIEESGLGSLTYTPSICLTKKRVELNKILDLPKSQHIQTILPIGYYNERPKPKDFDYSGKVHINKFEEPIEDE